MAEQHQGQASERAVEAAAKATGYLNREGVGNPGPDFFSTPYARASLVAAHDPALGLDRSVRLGDVIAALRGMDPSANGWGRYAAEFVEDTFTFTEEAQGG